MIDERLLLILETANEMYEDGDISKNTFNAITYEVIERCISDTIHNDMKELNIVSNKTIDNLNYLKEKYPRLRCIGV